MFLRKLRNRNSLVNSSCGSSSNGDIVDEDRDNEANTISGIDIHRGIKFEASESKGFKCGMKLLVPKSTCLFVLKSDLNQGIDRPGSHTNALEHNESSLLIQKLIYLPGTQ